MGIFDKLFVKKAKVNTKIDPTLWTRTGQTLEEKFRQQVEEFPSNVNHVAIINLADYIAPKEQNAFQVCVLNGEPHVVANVVIEDKKVSLLRKSIKNNWIVLRASFHQYPEYPLIYVRMVFFFSATELQKVVAQLTGTLIECLPDFTNADFQEWAITMRKTLNTKVVIYDLEDRELASGKCHFDESRIDDLIKVIDQANSALKTIPKRRQNIMTAVQSFYTDYSEPFL